MLGSVARPVKRPPKAWPNTQESSASAAPATRKAVVWRDTSGPRPMTNDSRAAATATEPPPLPKAWETDSCTWASQPGSPATDARMAPAMLPPARFAGSSHRIPMPLHTTAQRAGPPRTPSGPSAAAGPRTAGPAARGHTSTPMAT